MHYLYGENKGADQLCDHCTADLRLCFRICKKAGFLMTRLIVEAPGECLFCLFGLRLYVTVNNFSVMSGRSHRFLGIASTYGEVNVSCSRIHQGDPIEPGESYWHCVWRP